MGIRAEIHALVDELPDEELPAVRTALKAVRNEPTPDRKRNLLELAGDLVGCLKGGPEDLETNPAHLADLGE